MSATPDYDELPKLHELSKVDFYDVLRQIKPGYEWSEYEKDWAEFQQRKARQCLSG